MPGFVDVSNMSYRDVQRMGHMDDDTPEQPARRGRYATRAPGQKYAMDLIWAAAAAAQRVNGAYFKVDQVVWDEQAQRSQIVKRRNRDVMMEFVTHPDRITEADRAQGQQARQYLQQDLTFRALKGRLNDFDQATSKVLAVTDEFDSVLHRYELAIVACLPSSAQRGQKRANSDERVQFARGGFIAQPGAKVLANVEVLSAVFSQNYNCWFIKGITDKDQPVFFSYREGMDAGTHLTIQGTVKAHRDNLTQLNRVKVL